MDQIGVRIPEELNIELEDRAEDLDQSKSETVRDLLRKGLDYNSRINSLKGRIDELQDQLVHERDRDSDVGELVEFVEDERDHQRVKNKLLHAPIWRRIKWKLVGVPQFKDDDQKE